MHIRPWRSVLLMGTILAASAPCGFAAAEEPGARLGTIEKQIQSLQAELRHMRQEIAEHNRAAKAAEETIRAAQAQAAVNQGQALRRGMADGMPQIPPGYALVPASPGSTAGTVVLAREQPAGPPLPQGAFRVGNVTVTLGGFIEAAGIYRSRNEVADIASNFNTGIPLRNSPLYHEGEFRETARQSRFSALATGKPDPDTTISAFAEFDLNSSAPTANSVESNSYNIRVRHAYATYDRSDLGFELLGGQTWSLLTMDRTGIIPRKENIPVQIDAQYIPGFTWARQPQLRIVKSFDNQAFWLAASLENPQVNYYTGPNGLAPSTVGTINNVNPGGSGFASTVNYSNDIAPDTIVKAAADFPVAHVEAYGLGRVMHNRVSEPGDGQSNTTFAGGGGAAALIHVIPKLLDIQGSFLAGDGIGRYGSAQLPDAVVGSDGHPLPLPEVEALVGIVGHPIPVVDLYGYAGTEQISRRYFAADKKGYGYGSPLYSNSSCDVELGASSSCVGNTSGIVQGTVGGWWRFLKGDYGTMQTGIQYSYTHRAVFQGIGATPKSDENMVFLSFRYYPFQ
jgi:hypothetical protein